MNNERIDRELTQEQIDRMEKLLSDGQAYTEAMRWKAANDMARNACHVK